MRFGSDTRGHRKCEEVWSNRSIECVMTVGGVRDVVQVCIVVYICGLFGMIHVWGVWKRGETLHG